MRRRILFGAAGVVLVAAAIVAFAATRPPPFDAFPEPPSPSIGPDGSRVSTIEPGTSVDFLPGTIEPGDVIVCRGKGRRVVPQPSVEIDGAIYVSTDANGAVMASCEPHPLAEM